MTTPPPKRRLIRPGTAHLVRGGSWHGSQVTAYSYWGNAPGPGLIPGPGSSGPRGS